MPLVAGVLFLGSTVCKHLSDRIIMKKTKTDKFYLSKMIGVFMLLMYYLYLMTARAALQIFNCNPSEPDDGFLYTQFADEECDGGMCRCNDPNHIQVRLIFPAVLALFVYTLGYPVLVYLVLRANKHLVKEDQLLRTLNTGDTPGTNKYAYHIRRRFHKLYYHFKPGKWYWIVIIIMRKAGIVVAGLMFRANPGFQLSLILLVLFSAYVVQVKHQPYMSTAQRKTVILDHQEKAKNGHPLHVGLAARIAEAVAIAKGGGANNIQRSKQFSLGSESTMRRDEQVENAKRRKAKNQKREYFWDYNTVEQVLLSCGIFVCLSGVMFESDRFTADEGKVGNEPGKATFEWQREVIVYAVMAVVIFSFVFYFSVFFSEALGITPTWVKKCFAKKHKTHIDKLIQMGHDEGKSDIVSMNMNPLQKKMLEKEAAKAAAASSAFQLKEMEDQQKATEKKFKSQLATARKQGTNGRVKKRTKGKKKKKKVAGQKFTNVELDLGINDEVIAIGASKEGTSKAQQVAQKRGSSFSKVKDPMTGKEYYHNLDTRETVWTLPADGVVVEPHTEKKKRGSKKNKKDKTVNIELGSVSSGKNATPTGVKRFSKQLDSATGRYYYHNIEDGTTTWTTPPEDEIILN
jgi:hypothetical protein